MNMMSSLPCGSVPTCEHGGFNGGGFTIRRTLCLPVGNRESYRCHILQLNDGSPFSYSWTFHGNVSKGICPPGNFVQLLSKGDRNPLQCEREFHAIELTFDACFIDKILEQQDSAFGDRCNFDDALLSEVVRELYRSACTTVTENLYLESLATACAIHLAAGYAITNKRVFSLKGKLASHQLKRVIAFVRETINRTVTLEELAMCCHLSVFHFSRLFKNTLNVSPYQYVLRTKIEHARNLIRSKKAVGEIAYILGFTDSAHFCNAFKRFTGHSPLQDVAISHGRSGIRQRSFSSVIPVS